MTRRGGAFGVAIALVIGPACGSRPSAEPAGTGAPAAPADAAPPLDATARTVDADVQAYLDHLEARPGPPSPTIRKYRQGDCSTAYAPRPDRDPNPMCRITGGTFMMGGRVDSGPPAFGPIPEPVATTVRDFDIDQFEVTAQQAALFLNAHGNHCPGLHGQLYQNPEQCVMLGMPIDDIEERRGRYYPKRGRERAAVWFTLEGAMRYCAWVGKQVPSSAQWEYAARHDPATGRDLVFAWGDKWDQQRVDCYFEGKCTRFVSDAERRLVGRFDGTHGRGDGSSPWGLHDTIDNIEELVFACGAPDETCRAGVPCACRPLESTAGQFDPISLATFARIDARDGDSVGLRCARLR